MWCGSSVGKGKYSMTFQIVLYDTEIDKTVERLEFCLLSSLISLKPLRTN